MIHVWSYQRAAYAVQKANASCMAGFAGHAAECEYAQIKGYKHALPHGSLSLDGGIA